MVDAAFRDQRIAWLAVAHHVTVYAFDAQPDLWRKYRVNRCSMLFLRHIPYPFHQSFKFACPLIYDASSSLRFGKNLYPVMRSASLMVFT